MQPNEIAEATGPQVRAQRVRLLTAAFRNILVVVFLIFVFAVVRTIVLWSVSDAGMKTATALEHQGLPTLNALASLQEQLAIYRLNSYEYLFAQEKERAAKARAVAATAALIRAELKTTQTLLPAGEGQDLAAHLQTAVTDLDTQFQKVRSLVDADFPAAMKSMDQDIPPRIERVATAAKALKDFGYGFSGGQANATFASFGSIKHTAVIFGIANIGVIFCAFMFVLLAARRSRAQLADTLARLDERTHELQQTNGVLQRQQTELRVLFDYLPAMIVFKDTQNVIVRANHRLAEIVGKSIGEIEGKPTAEIFPQEAAQYFADDLEVIRSGTPKLGIIETVRDQAGKALTIQTDKVPVCDPAGKVVGLIAMAQDITARQLAEQALLESRRFLRSTLDALSSHIAILDEHGTIIEVNAAWNRFASNNNFIGGDRGVGDNYLKVCDAVFGKFSEEASAVAIGLRAIMAGQREEFHLEYPCHSPTEKRWFVVRITRFSGDGPAFAGPEPASDIAGEATARRRPVRVVVAHENITERKQAETSLVESQQRLALAKESAQIGIWDWDVGANILVWDARMFELYGIRAPEFSGAYDAWQKGLHPDERARGDAAIHAALAGDKDFHIEFRVVWPGGEVRHLEGSATVIRADDGTPTRMIGVNWDITERKKLEAQLFQSQKMETVGKLAGGVAHEFNSILTAIIGQSELLLDDLPAGGSLAESATEITKAANRAATLTRQLLAYGRKQFLQLEVLNLNSVLAATESTLRHLLGRGVDVRLALAADVKPVKADAGQIEQVLMNLAMNAADAMPNGGKLTLETANVTLDEAYTSHFPELIPGDYVMLAVTDTGRGMTEAVKARLFEPFFTTKDVGEGTGLGLSTCYGIVKQSGGHMSVYSEPGRGTTFKIYLPQVEPLTPPLPRLESSDLPRGTETILLVEDDPALRDMAATLLRRLGYTVLAAANGIDALSLKQQPGTGHIDLLFTDVVMPHMSGKELADRVRALYPHTKILFTSAYTEHAIVHQGALAQGVTLLQKPFTPSALAHKLRAVLDQPGASDQSVVGK
jgi:PAS domain S-box-containing protein